MTETIEGAPALVTELDEERRRYESWLEQLEARRGATPERVYARVRDDYRARLQQVVDRLAEHAEALRAAAGELETRVGQLRADEQRVQDDRAEAELRAMVGEFPPDRWQALQAESDERLGDLGRRRQEAEVELGRLHELLALAAGATRMPGVVEPEPPPAASLADMAAGSGAAAAVRPMPEVERELAADEVPMADEMDGWSRELTAEAPPMPERPRPQTPADGGTVAIKTLRCQECGTMNYPTEWYCERCGGELAAM